MNWDQAIAAHAAWKMKLASYVKKPDGSLKAAEVASDCRCELGKWITTEATKYAVMEDFKVLKAEHARFHKVASEIVRRADAGEDVSEEIAVGAHSEFRKSSTSVVNAIVAMRSKA
jgi:methyl-accepting chemotaxis protein